MVEGLVRGLGGSASFLNVREGLFDRCNADEIAKPG